MADIIQYEIKGLDELQKALQEEQPKKARLALRVALSAGGGTVKDAMQDMAPVEVGGQDSGFLRGHLKVKTIIQRGELAGMAIVGATTDAYPNREGSRGRVTLKTRTGKVVSFMSNKGGQVTAAMVAKWLELGTTRMTKHPFLSTGWEGSKQAALDRIVAKLKEQLHL